MNGLHEPWWPLTWINVNFSSGDPPTPIADLTGHPKVKRVSGRQGRTVVYSKPDYEGASLRVLWYSDTFDPLTLRCVLLHLAYGGNE